MQRTAVHDRPDQEDPAHKRVRACPGGDRQNPHIDAFYAAIGQPRPAVLEHGEHVHKWRKAQR
ncbi:MAG TPA: hypothetical protein VI542_04045 [Candidatus Tectomicrobia bacterium]